MKTKSIFIGLLIILSSLFFGNVNTVKAETPVSPEQTSLQPRIELVWINGVLWLIIYDADENIIQASAIGHAE